MPEWTQCRVGADVLLHSSERVVRMCRCQARPFPSLPGYHILSPGAHVASVRRMYSSGTPGSLPCILFAEGLFAPAVANLLPSTGMYASTHLFLNAKTPFASTLVSTLKLGKANHLLISEQLRWVPSSVD